MDFLQLFLNKKANRPLYYQLYKYVSEEIRAGRIPAGEKLPGKRSAAAQLGVSVNTVNEAYQQLAAEGYVQAKPRSGFVVCRLEQMVPPPLAQAGQEAPAPGTAGPQAGRQVDAPPQWRHSFSSGGLDVELFPLKTWNRLLREVLAREDGLFLRGPAAGDEALREAIARYVQSYRGVRCTAGHIVVGAGLEVLIGLLARLLAERLFALEDPGYAKTARILGNMGVAHCHVPVDEDGMKIEALVQSGAQVAYLTPSHQLPTGGVMPAPRRSELLRWAAAKHRLIVEDDYDSEYRFDGRPLPCLQGMDEHECVVYAGTFTRSLAPGLRAAYLVLPAFLQARWHSAYGNYACTVSRPEQHTLARLLAEGHFARSLNRARNAYHKRRDALLAALRQALPMGAWWVQNAHTGLYFVLRLPGKDAVQLAHTARADGLNLHALDEYRNAGPSGLQSGTRDALVVGYGGLSEEEIPVAAQALAKACLG